MIKKIKFSHWVIILSCSMYSVVALLPVKAKPFGDWDFHMQSKQIAQFFWGQTEYNSLVINKAPGPVLFYVTPYFLAGPSASDQTLWLFGIIWSFFFLTAALLMVRKAALNFGYDLAGRIAVLTLLVLPLHLYYSLGILAEGLAFFGCCLFLFGWSIVWKENSNKLVSGGWISLVLGLLCILLARPNSILIVPFIVVSFLIFRYFKDQPFYRTIQKTFFGAMITLILLAGSIALWVKNLPANRSSSTQEGYLAYVMMIGRFQFREETWDWRFWDGSNRPDSKDYVNYQNEKLYLKERANSESKSLSSTYYNFIRKDIIEHPLITLKQFGVRVLFGHVLQVNSINQDSFGVGQLRGSIFFWGFHIALNLFNIIFVLSALYRLKKDWSSENSLLSLLAVPWLALVVFHGFVYMEQRYLFPVRPIIILVGSIVIADYLLKNQYLLKRTHYK